MLHTLLYYVVGTQLFADGGTSYRQDGQLVLVPKEWTVGLGKRTRKCTKARNNDLSDTERTWKMNSQPLRFMCSATKKCSIIKNFIWSKRKKHCKFNAFKSCFLCWKYTQHDDVLFRMLANERFCLSKCAPNPTKRKRLGDYSAPSTEAKGIWGLVGEAKYVHAIVLFYCSITRSCKVTQSNISSLSYNFHGSGVQTQLTWVPGSGFYQASSKVWAGLWSPLRLRLLAGFSSLWWQGWGSSLVLAVI